MLNYAVPVSFISLGLQQTGPDTLPDLLLTPIKYCNLQEFSEWAMLDLNQRPPPCKLGKRFPGRFCPVGNPAYLSSFLAAGHRPWWYG